MDSNYSFIASISTRPDFTIQEIVEAFTDCEELDIPGQDFFYVLNDSQFVITAYENDIEGNRRIIGIIQVLSDMRWSAVINFVYVRPEYRGKGVGTLMMQALVAKLRGIKWVYVAPNNMDVAPFYERFGLSKVEKGGLLMYENEVFADV